MADECHTSADDPMGMVPPGPSNDCGWKCKHYFFKMKLKVVQIFQTQHDAFYTVENATVWHPGSSTVKEV